MTEGNMGVNVAGALAHEGADDSEVVLCVIRVLLKHLDFRTCSGGKQWWNDSFSYVFLIYVSVLASWRSLSRPTYMGIVRLVINIRSSLELVPSRRQDIYVRPTDARMK